MLAHPGRFSARLGGALAGAGRGLARGWVACIPLGEALTTASAVSAGLHRRPAVLQARVDGAAGPAAPGLAQSGWRERGGNVGAQAAQLCGGRLPLRFQQQQHPTLQLRGMADGGKRWDGEADGSSRGGGDSGGAGGVVRHVDPLHPHGLNISVINGNADLAMRKLRRKVIVEGVMKKFKKNRVSKVRGMMES
jgi:hypothetical protein